MTSRYANKTGNQELKNTDYDKSESDSDSNEDESTTDRCYMTERPIYAKYLDNIKLTEQPSASTNFQLKKTSQGGKSLEKKISQHKFSTFKGPTPVPKVTKDLRERLQSETSESKIVSTSSYTRQKSSPSPDVRETNNANSVCVDIVSSVKSNLRYFEHDHVPGKGECQLVGCSCSTVFPSYKKETIKRISAPRPTTLKEKINNYNRMDSENGSSPSSIRISNSAHFTFPSRRSSTGSSSSEQVFEDRSSASSSLSQAPTPLDTSPETSLGKSPTGVRVAPVEETQKEKVFKVATELLTTEKQYVRILRLIEIVRKM